MKKNKKNKSNQLRLWVKPETGKKFEDCEFKWVSNNETHPNGFIRAKNLKFSEEGFILNAPV